MTVTNPILRVLCICILVGVMIIFIPIMLCCILIGLLGYCLGVPATIKINGETRKYRWNKRIA